MSDNSDSNRRPNTPDHLKEPGSFISHLLLNPKARVGVMEAVSIASHNQYQVYRPALEATLSATELALYSESQKIPYASKDWYRDLHDLIVTASLEVIVNRENEAKRLEPLPRWLVGAALLHDRGYGILAAQGAAVQGSLEFNSKETAATEYIARGGAHWEQPDTRVLHSCLSRDLAEFLLFPESAAPAFASFCKSKGVEPILSPHEVVGLADREIFLSVIEKHDHPLIGRYDELQPVGWHHFDADSLFSLSLSSFVKDYLSYCSDAGKMKRAYDLGLCAPGAFTPYVLLEARLARYFPTEESLPIEWHRVACPLVPNAVAFSESGRCIEPHSETARELTTDAFFDLVECCKVLAEIESEQEFLLWFNDALKAQCEALFRRIEAISQP
jgi:hypothetical protein